MPGKGLVYNPDPRTWVVSRTVHGIGAAPLPAFVDLRGWVHGVAGLPDAAHPVGPVRDQGQQGACVAFAHAELLSALRVRAGAPAVTLSPSYLYARTRIVEGTLTQDAGSDPTDAMKILATYGCAPLADDSYSDAVFNLAPTPLEDALAYPYRIAAFHSVPDYATAKQVLATGAPVTVCVRAYDDWDNCGSDGVLNAHIAQETRPPNHCVLLVGYWDGYALVQNQWGTGWGWGGICCIPEEIAGTVLSYCLTAVVA